MSLATDQPSWTVPAQLRQRAVERPGETAHRIVGGDVLTFADWDGMSSAAARGLAARGTGPGDRVVLPCSTGEWTSYAVAWAAVLKAGAVAVPVPRSAGAGQFAAICQASRAVGCIGAPPAGVPGWCATVSELASGQSSEPVAAVPVTPDSDAEISYTSGTTGTPKGVVASHANLVYALMHSRADRPAVALHALPPGTTVGQGLLVQPLGPAPHSVLALPRFTPRDLLLAVERERPTHLVLVPAMAIALVSSPAPDRCDLRSVRQVRTTSAPIHPATLEQLARLFPGARIRNVYSTTESWPRRVATDYDRARPRSLGRPAAGAQLRIVDGSGREVPPGVPGDVQLRGDAPRRRYDGERGPSAVFLDGGWTRTGDIGMTDEDGYFYLLDRNPDLVITGGLNVSTLDLEATIMEYPGVVEAAVCGVPHPVLGECVLAAVRAAPGLDPGALTQYVRERRGSAAPQRIVAVSELPRTMLGKVDKRRLRELLAARRGGEPLRTPAEKFVAGVWAAVLDCGEVSAADDFLRLGGSSLTAMEVVSEVAAGLGRKVRVRDLLDTTSLRAFAARVEAAPPAELTGQAIGAAAPEPA
jgi:acyl-CoA synthetase (AMP-forming)/AMP-acid ligase II